MIVIAAYPTNSAEIHSDSAAQSPTSGVPLYYYILVMTLTVVTSFAGNVMFVSQGAFFAIIGDPRIGGTYMTLLNTASNFGSNWPKFFIFEGVDYFTRSYCSVNQGEASTLSI